MRLSSRILLGLLSLTTQLAWSQISGTIYQNIPAPTDSGNPANQSNSLPHASFTSPAINYDSNTTGFTPTLFLNGAVFTGQANGFNPNGSLNNTEIVLTGSVFLNSGNNSFVAAHDDGLILTITGIGTVVNSPGPQGASFTPFNVNNPGAAGFFPFTLQYAECCSAPATLIWRVNGGLVGTTPPTISKSFPGLVSIGAGETATVRFVITNPNAIALTGVGFGDTLPTGLVVANPSVTTTTCGGAVAAVAGSGSIAFSGGTIAAGASCTVTVDVSANGAAIGLLTNTTGPVTSDQTQPGAAASAVIFVGNPFQVSYFPNLNLGDSAINITNAGTLGASLASGTSASTTGALCANVYAFSPDEQLIGCCSCPVTPNGLVSLSANADLVSNTLTPAVPNSIVVKLLATVPVGGSCTNSAAAGANGTVALANGMLAFGTKVHGGPAGALSVTETPFSGATLSAGELSRIENLCNFIIANGSGFGICRSCRLGGLGAVGQ